MFGQSLAAAGADPQDSQYQRRCADQHRALAERLPDSRILIAPLAGRSASGRPACFLVTLAGGHELGVLSGARLGLLSDIGRLIAAIIARVTRVLTAIDMTWVGRLGAAFGVARQIHTACCTADY